MNVRFVAGFSAIVDEAAEGRRFYGEKLSLPVKFDEGSDYSVVGAVCYRRGGPGDGLLGV